MTAASLTFLNPAELVRAYPTLNNDSIRNNAADLVASYALKGHKIIGENMSYNPFPASHWETWDNITTQGQPKKFADEKVVKNKTTKDAEGKRIELSETEEKDQRLRHAVSFNADSKTALAFVITNLVHEALMARSHITAGLTDQQIMDAIVVNNTGDYCISQLVFAICETFDDKRMDTIFDQNVGKFSNIFTGHLSKLIKEPITLQKVVLNTVLKFLKAFALYISSQSWFETKPISETAEQKKGPQPPAEQFVGVPKNLSDRTVRQFLMDRDLLLLNLEDRLSGQFFRSMSHYNYQSDLSDEEKKIVNAQNREEKKIKSAEAEAAKKVAAATATTEVAPPVAAATATADVTATVVGTPAVVVTTTPVAPKGRGKAATTAAAAAAVAATPVVVAQAAPAAVATTTAATTDAVTTAAPVAGDVAPVVADATPAVGNAARRRRVVG